MFKRALAASLPDHSFFLFGPRQVGKSTIFSSIPAQLSLDLLDPRTELLYTKDPTLLAREVEAIPKEGTVIVDEIQRAPKLLDVIHQLMERYPRLRFAMSGSSARKLRHGASNLLGGRALYLTLHPLSMLELGEVFSLEKVLHYGSLPKMSALLLEGKEVLVGDLLRAYVTTYLKEEVKAEALVRNLQGFQNFLDVAAAQFGEQVNFSSIARDCLVSYSTVREFYSILEDTLMGCFLRPYLGSTRKRMSHAPKFYFFDTGVTRALLQALASPPTPRELGRLFEQWVVQELIRKNAYERRDWKLSFWRTAHGAEVDILVEYGKSILCAIECKYKSHIDQADLSGVFAFLEEYPRVPAYVVAPVPRPLVIDKVRVVPPALLWEAIGALQH